MTVSARRRRTGLAAWGFALPFAVLFAVFMLLPVASSLYMAFTDMHGADLKSPWAVNFVGLDNFVAVLGDPKFQQAAGNTLYFVGVAMPLTLGIALLLAVLLNSGLVWFRSVFRVGFYAPVVTSIVAVAVVWRFLLQPDFGLVNSGLGVLGIDGPRWLTDEVWAMPSLIVMATWRNVGYSMVILLAGLQGIPRDLYEASAIDGAGAVRQFRSITVPLLRPTLLFCAVITGIGYLQFFEEPFVMTQGGPLGATNSVAYEIFNQFGFGNYGVSAAMSYVLFVAIVILSYLQFRLLRTEK
ncbi:carbohydrate ABC transporter permease [Promicromonospora iranensis]|uniref:Multiple sugar transport system permease protein n=1 Tax=Promicromonospora iranensis TaxID=1105144 RepID=A0ABU2CUA1_9MICO|nr:sugar ABC transporter permease [Promicromonospora iranensis]MDR7384899.1 multiple sugar transport system permease protein [Promicromonospora iranensis]